MNRPTQVIMWLIVAAVILAVLRNAAGAVGIILGGGEELNNTLGTLSGGKGTVNNKGTFKTASGSTIKLG